MAQAQRKYDTTVTRILKLANTLPPEKQEQLVDEMKLQWLKNELQISIDQADRGEVVDGDEVFRLMRQRNTAFRRKAKK